MARVARVARVAKVARAAAARRQGCGGTCRQKECREPVGCKAQPLAWSSGSIPASSGRRPSRTMTTPQRGAPPYGQCRAEGHPRPVVPLGQAAAASGLRLPSRRAGELLESNLRLGHGLVAKVSLGGCRLARYQDERVHHLAADLVKEHATAAR